MSHTRGGKMFGQMVADKRRELGKSQQELADAAGITRVYVSEIERGRVSNPSVDMLFALAGALDTDAAELLSTLQSPTERARLLDGQQQGG